MSDLTNKGVKWDLEDHGNWSDEDKKDFLTYFV
jgi:hypothetical protein